MNIITGLVVIISVAIVSFTTLIITDKIQINEILSSPNLESQLQQINARVNVLYGNPPSPVETNHITLPLQTDDLTSYCHIRYNCVQPYSIVVHAGDFVTWTNKDLNGHYVEQCGGGNNLIGMSLGRDQSLSVKFDKAGQYDYCVNGYYREVQGIIFVK